MGVVGKIFNISPVWTNGILRIPPEFAAEFEGQETVRGRASTPDGEQYPIVIDVAARTLDGLGVWLRSLPEETEYHSFQATVRSNPPLSLNVEPSSTPTAPRGDDTKSIQRPPDEFFLGRKLEDTFNELVTTEEAFTIDETDLLTHAFICGVTGAGKTVLGKILLEEAAQKGIPAIAIDLKGDISSLALLMSGEDETEVLPFVHPERNMTPEESAAKISAEHRRNLAKWGFTSDDVEVAKKNIAVNVFTPRSNNGFRLALSAFPEPPGNLSELQEADPDDYESLLEFLTKQFVARLTLNRNLKEKAEGYLFEILKSSLRDEVPMHGYDGVKRVLDEFSAPYMGIDQIGGLAQDEYITEEEREKVANAVNALLTGAATGMYEGWPLNIDGLIGGKESSSRTTVSIINLSHLEFKEQAYVVGYVAYLIMVWMRRLPGTYAPRLIFYVDEIGGGGGKTAFFPSVANSPCKPALNILLRQGRAYGVSCVLATQNPGDIDYKGLSNCGTWVVGRLRTLLDQDKIAQGAADADLEFESARRYLPGLKTGQFIVRTPTVPWTIIAERWLMGIHRPLAAAELRKLKESYEKEAGLQLEKAKELFDESRIANAVSLLRDMISEYPYSMLIAGAHLLLGRTLIEANKLGEAREELEQILKRWVTDDEFAEAKFLLGMCDEKESNFERAATRFEEARQKAVDAEFKYQAGVHADYCEARNTWADLPIGGKFIWWIRGRKPDESRLVELQIRDDELLTKGHKDRLDRFDWSVPPEIDYSGVLKARESAHEEEIDLTAQAVKDLEWAERQLEKMQKLREVRDFEALSALGRRVVQRLQDGDVIASERVIAELRRASQFVGARRAEVHDRVTHVEARQFEYDIASLFERMGYSCVVTRATADDGVDLFAKKNGERLVVQCKKWDSKTIGRSLVDELGGTASRYGATGAILVTTSKFSPDAIRAAGQLDMQLWDFDKLASLYDEFGRQPSTVA